MKEEEEKMRVMGEGYNQADRQMDEVHIRIHS
jgi:hypothetical protein